MNVRPDHSAPLQSSSAAEVSVQLHSCVSNRLLALLVQLAVLAVSLCIAL